MHYSIQPVRVAGAIVLAGLAAVAAAGPARAQTSPSSSQTLAEQVSAASEAAQAGTLPAMAFPDSVVSSGGVLNAVLVALPATYTLGGVTDTANLYNGLYTPPTLVLNPGDSVALQLGNAVRYPSTGETAVTNLHYHGFNVTPMAPGDDVLMHIPFGVMYQYAFRMPTWHRPGLYWYHPHPHGLSETQVLGGMSGAIVVEGLIESYFPQFAGVTERVMLLKDHFPASGDTSAALTKSINGMTLSQIQIQPGEKQLWRFGNVGANAYFNVKLVDANLNPRPMLVLAHDGNPVIKAGLYADSLVIPPSSRVEVIVQGETHPLYLISDTVDTGPDGDPNPPVVLAVAGTTVMGGTPPAPLTTSASAAQLALADTMVLVLAASVGANQRTFVFSEDTTTNTFFINGKTYDPDRVDTRITIPTTEVWTLQNTSREVHVFHIHQGDFLVTEINGVAQDPTGFVDTVNLPYSEDGVTPTTVKIVIPFTNPGAAGEFVYHCHILQHEDLGMMQNIVLSTAPAPGAAPPAPTRGHGGRH